MQKIEYYELFKIFGNLSFTKSEKKRSWIWFCAKQVEGGASSFKMGRMCSEYHFSVINFHITSWILLRCAAIFAADKAWDLSLYLVWLYWRCELLLDTPNWQDGPWSFWASYDMIKHYIKNKMMDGWDVSFCIFSIWSLLGHIFLHLGNS